jgi:Ser/Thr protein kinase RdoA (MazF antagonist)
MSIKPALMWAASQIGAGARVVWADEPSAGATPWRLRIDHRGEVVEAVLRVGDASGRQRLATEAAALLFAEGHRLPAPRLLPQRPTVFVHGDLWQGNTLWTADTYMGMVDWDAAGAGHPGIDLGTLRCDAAVVFGLPAAAEILRGWREATGRPAEATAYWDLVAALTTPTDMARWLPVAHHHGRADLTTASLNTRRDAFLRAALDQLPHN